MATFASGRRLCNLIWLYHYRHGLTAVWIAATAIVYVVMDLLIRYDVFFYRTESDQALLDFFKSAFLQSVRFRIAPVIMLAIAFILSISDIIEINVYKTEFLLLFFTISVFCSYADHMRDAKCIK